MNSFLVKNMDQGEVIIDADMYEINILVPILCGKESLQHWKVNIVLKDHMIGVKTQNIEREKD